MELRVPSEEHFESIFRLDGRIFGYTLDGDERKRQESLMQLDRFRIAVDGDVLVGAAGSYAFDTTLPGGRAVPTGGVTFVFVSVSHRRQGVLTRLMDAVHRDISDRGEPLASLTASEGGIYERFGYGVASPRRITLIDRRRAQVAERFRPPRGSVRLVEWDDPRLTDELDARWDRVRRLRAGEISRSRAWLAAQIGDRGASATWLLHDDGFANWKITQQWNEGHPAHELELLDLAAATPEAHVALWDAVLSVDLVGPIRSRVVAIDDPLPYLLTDPRALRTVELNDMLWCVPLDVPSCFAARSYGTDDDVVLECGDQRWSIGAGGCGRTRRRADLVVERSALGPVLMGVPPTTLAAGRRLTARTPEALRRADNLLTAHPAPHLMSGF